MDNVHQKFGEAAIELKITAPKISKLLKQVYALLPEGSEFEMKVCNPAKCFRWHYLKNRSDFSSTISKIES